jgi:hypothetical protein
MAKKKETRGGAREGAGRKKGVISVDPENKKIPVSFSVKKKYKEEFKKIVNPIVKKINKKN